MADTLPDERPGMTGALSQLAYGSGGNPMAQLPELLDKLSPASRDVDAENLGFWGGFGAPNTSGQLSGALGNAMKAQSDTRMEREKLKAAYVPLIMQSLIQGQQLTLSAANAGRDYLKDINPKFNAHMASLRTDDAVPTRAQAIEHALSFGDQYQMPQGLLGSHIAALPNNPEAMRTYLDRLAVAGAGPDKLLPTTGTNAAGQTTVVSPVRNTNKLLGTPGAGAGDASANPSKPSVDQEIALQGDPKEFEKGLRDENQAYQQMLSRMNSQAKYIQNFQPGRYAKMAGGLAAAVKDIGSRLPGVDPKTVSDLAAKIVGSTEGSPQALAAQQLFSQLSQQETIAQLRSTLGEGQKGNRNEYNAFAKVNLSEAMDPETFKGMREFYYAQAANAANKYSKWSDYVSDPAVKVKSVTGFDAAHNKRTMDQLLGGKEGTLDPAAKPTHEPSKPTYTPPVAAPAAAAPESVDLSLYEPGARVGPTGRVYVMDNGTPRAARGRVRSGKVGG